MVKKQYADNVSGLLGEESFKKFLFIQLMMILKKGFVLRLGIIILRILMKIMD